MRYLIVIVGPTAVGKTALAIRIAQHFGTEIVSADSRQFYRELNIGTAKPSAAELNLVPHHLINSLSIQDPYNAGKFETDALDHLLKIFTVNETAVLCGGSGLYVNIVCNGLDELPAADPAIRRQLEDVLDAKGIAALQELLKRYDPEYYNSSDVMNPHRLIRALEVCMITGKKFSDIRTRKKVRRPFETIKIGLEDERDIVYKCIDSRVDEMFKNGLLQEAKSLIQWRNLNALQTVGYQELFQYFDGKVTLDQAIHLIKQHTRNYAKRQWTWFRKDPEIKWFRRTDEDAVLPYLENAMRD